MKFSAFRERIKPLPLFSTSMLGTLTDRVNTLKVQLSRWKRKGWVHSLRKGLYVLSPQERAIEPPLFYLANQILIPSYVSLESALAYYGLIPEFVAAATSVTVRKTCRFKNEFGIFTYQHIQPKGFFGFQTLELSPGWRVLIAAPEKAVVDFLYLNAKKLRPDREDQFSGSYRFQKGRRLQAAKLRAYAKRLGKQRLSLLVESFIRQVLS